MKLIFENWRQYLNEGMDPRIQKQIDMLLALPDVAIKVSHPPLGGHKGFVATYVRTSPDGAQHKILLRKDSTVIKGDEKIKTGIPHGAVEMWKPGNKKRIGPCLDTWVVSLTFAESGWGPLLYEVALEWASQNGGGLTSDRDLVSGDAEAVWDKYAARSDVGAKQMDIAHWGEPSPENDFRDHDEYAQLTPNAPEDDCDQSIAIDKADDNWHESALSKTYYKGTPDVITALKEAGRWIEG